MSFGANPNIKDIDERIALHVLLDKENVNNYLVDKLLEFGSLPNSKDKSGKTPLHIVCYRITPNYKNINLLLEYGASIHEKTNTGNLVTNVIPVNNFSFFLMFNFKLIRYRP